MAFLIEIFWALLMVGVPIGVFTLALVWWLLQAGHVSELLDTKGLEREIKAMTRSNKKKNKDKSKEGYKKDTAAPHLLQKKWSRFGGGFYGIVAFFTYIVVETVEIMTMIGNFGGFFDFLRQLDFNVIIQMVISALTNFITAMIWPVYWMKRIDTGQTWIWFVMAYAGYWAGLKLAQLLIQRRLETKI